MAAWWKAVYGKLLGSDGITTTRDYDVSITGHSMDIPPELKKWCCPLMIGSGRTDQTNLRDYPWKEVGAYVLRNLVVGDERYTVVACLRPVSEGGRPFTQATYMATHTRCATIEQVFQIAKAIEVQPMAAPEKFGNFDIQEVEERLPPGWIEMVRPILRTVLAGYTLGVESRDESPAFAFRKMLLALAALPESIRWRMSVASGLHEFSQRSRDEMGVAHAQSVRDADVVFPARGEQAGRDYSFGERYLAQLRSSAEQFRTVGQLTTWVAEHYPHHRFDASCDAGWRDVVKGLKQESDIARYYASDKHPNPELDPLTATPDTILDIIVPFVGGAQREQFCDLLEQVADQSWKHLWWQCLNNDGLSESERALVSSLAMLLGFEPLVSKQLLRIATVKLPPRLREAIGKRLEEQWRVDSTCTSKERSWHDLIEASYRENAANWLRRWHRRHEQAHIEWAWNSESSVENLLDSWVQHTQLGSLLTLVRDRRATTNDLNMLEFQCNSLPNSLNVVARWAWQSGNYAEALILFEKLGPSWDESSIRKELRQPETRYQIAANLIDRVTYLRYQKIIVKYLLALWSYVPTKPDHVITPLRERLGSDEWRHILLGDALRERSQEIRADVWAVYSGEHNDRPDERQKTNSIGEDALPLALECSRDVVRRTVQVAKSHSAEFLPVLASWWGSASPADFAGCDCLPQAAELLENKCHPLAELSPIQASFIAKLSRCAGRSPIAPETVREIMSLAQLRAAAIAGCCPDFTQAAIQKTMAEAIYSVYEHETDRDFWKDILDQRGWTSLPVWRVLDRQNRADPDRCENRVLSWLNEAEFTKCFLKGLVARGTHLRKLNHYVFERLRLDAKDAAQILSRAENLPELQREITAYLRTHGEVYKRLLAHLAERREVRRALKYRWKGKLYFGNAPPLLRDTPQHEVHRIKPENSI